MLLLQCCGRRGAAPRGGRAVCYLIMSNKSNHSDELPEAQRRGNGSARAGTQRITTARPAGTAGVLTTCAAAEPQTRRGGSRNRGAAHGGS